MAGGTSDKSIKEKLEEFFTSEELFYGWFGICRDKNRR